MNKFAVNKSAKIMMILLIIRSMIIMIGLVPLVNTIMVMTMTIHDGHDHDHDERDDDLDDPDHYQGDDDHDYDDRDDDLALLGRNGPETGLKRAKNRHLTHLMTKMSVFLVKIHVVHANHMFMQNLSPRSLNGRDLRGEIPTSCLENIGF